MSKYLLDKFLFTVDRDPELVERYRDDPAGTVAWWEAEMANRILNCTAGERRTWLAFTDEERDGARADHDHVTLFEMGAHPFLTLTLFIAMFERDHGPLEYQIAYGKAMEHLIAALPRHRDLMRAAVLTRLRRSRRRTREHPDPTPGRRARSLVRVTAAPDRAARPAVRERHVVLRRRRPLPYVPGVQGVGGSSRRRHRPARGCGSPPRAGMAPGDGSLAELVRGRRRPTWCRSRTAVAGRARGGARPLRRSPRGWR